MASSLRAGFSVSGYSETIITPTGFFPSVGSLQFSDSRSREFMGKSLDLSNHKGLSNWNAKPPISTSVKAQASLCVSKALRWWEKILKPNMIEIHSAQELVDSLLNAGDRLVIVDFYSPGCGGCKALHPKICQLAESNSDAIFLKVNYEELKTMCHTLHIHVLPFFRFYRGAEGRVCSFSCTNATIKKFKDALAKYGADRCSLGPAKGLEESELLALASAGELPKDLALDSSRNSELEDLILQSLDLSGTLGRVENAMVFKEGNEALMA